jgi:hypothetical protein
VSGSGAPPSCGAGCVAPACAAPSTVHRPFQVGGGCGGYMSACRSTPAARAGCGLHQLSDGCMARPLAHAPLQLSYTLILPVCDDANAVFDVCAQVLRIVGAGPQEDGVHRLCLKGLRLHGTARVDLMASPSWGGGGSSCSQQPLVLAPGTFKPLHAPAVGGGAGGKGSRVGASGDKAIALRASAG